MTTASTEQHKALVQRYFDAINQQDFAALADIVSPDYDDHRTGQRGVEVVTAYFKQMHAIFANLLLTVEDVVAEGDRVVVRNVVSGTQQTEFMGIVPSGKAIRAEAIQIYRIEAGRLGEHWEVADFITILQQLGAYPTGN